MKIILFKLIYFSLFIFLNGCVLFKADKSSESEILKFHNKSIVADLHNDVMIRVVENGEDISKLTLKGHSDLPRFKTGGVDFQFFSVWLDPKYENGKAFSQSNLIIDSIHSFVEKNKNEVVLVKNIEDVKNVIKQKKFGVLIGVEGGHPIEDDLTKLESLYNRGMRYMALSWNNSTSWSSSAKDETSDTLNQTKKGLNDFGLSVVRKMNELGIIIDVSHVGEKTFYDVIQNSQKPIIASHSCVYKISPHFRNLKDEQILAIAKNGGVIFLNFYAGFLDSSYHKNNSEMLKKNKNMIDSLHNFYNDSMKVEFMVWELLKGEREKFLPPISVLVDHMDYIKNLTGSVDNIGLGSDFDGAEALPIGLNDVTAYPKITKELFDRGYSEKEIKKILGGNFLRIFKQVVK